MSDQIENLGDQNGANGALVARAELHGAAYSLAHIDLAARLFPKSNSVFSDRLLADIKRILFDLVKEIERELICPGEGLTENNGQSSTWQTLIESEFLSDQRVLDFVLVRAQEIEFSSGSKTAFREYPQTEIIQRLVNGANQHTADLAMALLIAQSRNGSGFEQPLCLARDLPADIFHTLVWRIVSVIEAQVQYDTNALHDSAAQYLAGHDESNTVQSRALQLIHALESSGSHKQVTEFICDPAKSLTLCFASLAIRSGLSYDQIVAIAADEQSTRLAILLRALGLDADAAVRLLFVFRESHGQNTRQMINQADYEDIPVASAKGLIAKWQIGSINSLPAPVQTGEFL